MSKKGSMRMTRGDRITTNVFYGVLFLIILLCAYPVYFTLIASFSSSTYVNSGIMMLYPMGFQTEGYKFVLTDWRISTGFLNSVIYTVAGTALGLAVSLMAGYSLSRKDLPGRSILMAVMVFTMYFSGGLIPTFLVVKQLGLVNTRLILILLGSVSVYNIILIRTYFQSTIPTELQEAAFIDGCSNIRFFFQFAVPLSKAICAVIALYLAVGYWNAYFNAMIYLNDNSKKPLQLFLRDILLSAKQTDDQTSGELTSEFNQMVLVIKYAIIVVSSVPMMLIYPFLQKYFVQGVMIGSLKG